MRQRWWVFSLLLFLVPVAPSAATNRDVPLSDPIYRAIDADVAAGKIPAVHYGQRPWSEVYIRQVSGERTAVTHGVKISRPTVRVDMGGASTRGSTTVPQNNLGQIALQASPFDFFREGRDVADGGAGTALEAYATASLGTWCSLTANPRGWVEFGTGGKTASLHGTLWEALLKIGSRHVELSVGRGRVLWGPAEHGGLLLTDHAPPFDMIRLSTPQPFRLPFFFRHIGTIQTTLLFAYIGPRYTPHGTVLSGYRVDIQPHPWVTAGLNHLVMMGGDGLVGPTAGEAITEFIGFVSPGHGSAATNHQAGVDLHLRFPVLRGTQIYAAYAYEDPDTALEIQFDGQAAWMIGVYLPRLTPDGRWRLRAEYWRAGAGMYRHSPYIDGWTLRGHGLGNPFGGDSNSAWATLAHDLSDDIQLEGRVGMIQRSSNSYNNVANTSGDRIAIVTAIDGPEEVTAFTQMQLALPLGSQLTGLGIAGYAHAWNADFVAGRARHQVMAGIGVTWRP